MSFFGLGDIKFNKQQNTGFGPLAALEGTKYQYNTFRYPLDVGNYDKGHYMVIYIREQQVTTDNSPTIDNNPAFDNTPSFNNPKNIPPHLISKNTTSSSSKNVASQIDKKFGNGRVGQALNSVSSGVKGLFNNGLPSLSTQAVIDNSIKKITDKGFGFLRKTSRTTDAIALYMPDTLQFDYTQSYANMRPGDEVFGQLAAAAPGLVDSFKKGGGGAKGATEAAIAAAKSGAGRLFAEQVLGSVTGAPQTARLGLFGATGKVLNPMLEMLYSAPDFRSFQFDFLFYPRSEAEGEEVQKLIERLRYHQAPDLSLNDSGQNDGLLIPPSEFEISFYYGGSENPNIPQIGQCVLERIQVNYAPSGFSAYEVPGENKPTLGRTGMPVAIQMTLNFKEITYLTKADFRKDLPTLKYPY
jgi:hypothetical protein